MIFEEKTIKKETIYEGKILNLRRDVVQAAGGEATREVIEHNGAVAMVAMTAENKVILRARSTRVRPIRIMQRQGSSRKRPVTRPGAWSGSERYIRASAIRKRG